MTMNEDQREFFDKEEKLVMSTESVGKPWIKPEFSTLEINFGIGPGGDYSLEAS